MRIKENALRFVFIVLVNLFIFANVFFVNIVFHEIGHYMAADYFGLEPEMELELENIESVAFGLESVELASTSFIDNGNKEELAVIAAMGPFANLILSVFFLFLFVYARKKRFISEMGLIGAVVSIKSYIINILPFIYIN